MTKSFSNIIATYKELEKLPDKIKERIVTWCKANHLNHRRVHNLFTENFYHAKYSPHISVNISTLYESRTIIKEEVPLEIVKQDAEDLEKEIDIWEREYFPPAQYIEDSFFWMLPKIFEMKSCTYCGKIDPACRYCKGGGKIALIENVKVKFSPEFHQSNFSEIDDKVFLSNLTSPLKIFETESEEIPETYNLSEKYIDLVKKSIS
ncbi:hypothetical protein KAJ27_23310, partial [bacterium]|nr:hypothetical protein [bacterium]